MEAGTLQADENLPPPALLSDKFMLTSKLATAGRPGPINSHNKKVGADHVVSAM